MRVKSLERRQNMLRWIDQTRLPSKLEHKETCNYQEIIGAIKRLEIRGAPAIGIAAAYGMAVAVSTTGRFDRDFIAQVGREFKEARPTAVNLFWAVDRMISRFDSAEIHSAEDAADVLWSEAGAIHSEDAEMCDRIGQAGSQLISNGLRILTHCNTGALATGGSGTALAVIYTCRDQGKQIKVYADETRPLLQGSRLTAWELMQEGIDVTLICDNTAGMLMKQGKIDAVIVGADRITRNGDVANKIGTYSVAVLAKENSVPFYVAAPSSTFDQALESGNQIVIEERPGTEVTNGFGVRLAPENVDVYSPAFDVTPAELVSCYITDLGLKRGKRSGWA